MPRIPLNGTFLSYEDEGEGKALVFIPGLGATHGMFEPQADAFRATHRLIRPDLRGNGQSGRLAGPIGSILDRQCVDLAALVDHLSLAEVVMIGVSDGGTVALRFALRHPNRLAGLVAVDTFAELRGARPMEALLLAGSYLTLWAYYLPRPLMKAWAGSSTAAGRWPAASSLPWSTGSGPPKPFSKAWRCAGSMMPGIWGNSAARPWGLWATRPGPASG